MEAVHFSGKATARSAMTFHHLPATYLGSPPALALADLVSPARRDERWALGCLGLFCGPIRGGGRIPVSQYTPCFFVFFLDMVPLQKSTNQKGCSFLSHGRCASEKFSQACCFILVSDVSEWSMLLHSFCWKGGDSFELNYQP